LTQPEYLIKSKYTKLEDKKLSHLEFHIVHTSEMSHEVIMNSFLKLQLCIKFVRRQNLCNTTAKQL